MKDRNTGRIDGIVALIMVGSRAIGHKEMPSYYDTHGIIELQW